MTSIKQFAFARPVAEADAALARGISPSQARTYLSAIKTAYDKDCAEYGESAVKSTPAYARLVATQGKLEEAAAGAVNRASRSDML